MTSSRPQSSPMVSTPSSSPPLTFLLLLIASLALSSLFPKAEAALAVRANDTVTLNYASWDPFQGKSPSYSLAGILVKGQVQKDCTVTVPTAAGPSGQAIMKGAELNGPIKDTILVLDYSWLDDCATFDDIFEGLPTLNAQLESMALPKVGAVVMDGNANSNEDFGSPFIQLANAKHWNEKAGLKIAFTGSDSVLGLMGVLETNNHAVLATTAQMDGPWNVLWRSIGFNVLIRGLDVLAGAIFVYGLWVLAFIAKAKQDSQHIRRYFILIPGILYLPLSIIFAPYKVTVPWRNAVYYLSLLFPFISLGLQIIMWSKLIYRIKRRRANKIFSYFSYVTIFVPVISAFLDGIGWLIPSVPTIRIIGEKGFSFVTPAVILVQAGLIFYFAFTFFKSLKGVAVSQTTRTALIKITVLNMAMISFFILMLLSRIVSLLGLNMRNRSAYVTELGIFRFSFLFFYAACFRTLSIRQPTGSTVDSKGANSTGGGQAGGGANSHKTNPNAIKNHTHYHMDDFQSKNSFKSKFNSKKHSDEDGDEDTRPSLQYNRHLSQHASKGFTIPDPSSPGYKNQAYGGPVLGSPNVNFATVSQMSTQDFPDPYKFNEFGHLTAPSTTTTMTDDLEHGFRRPGYFEDEDDKESVYGSHKFGPPTPVLGGRVVASKKSHNAEGYSRFDGPDHRN